LFKKACILYLFFFSLSFSHANDKESFATENTKIIRKSLESLKDLEAKNYSNKIDDFRADLEKYFDHKKRVCDGEFSTVLLGSEKATVGKVVKKRVRLSRSERRLCFRELKALQVTFVNNMYLARKRYLNFLHDKRLKDLEDSRDATIKSLHLSFKR